MKRWVRGFDESLSFPYPMYREIDAIRELTEGAPLLRLYYVSSVFFEGVNDIRRFLVDRELKLAHMVVRPIRVLL
jgi:hypothetical protein